MQAVELEKFRNVYNNGILEVDKSAISSFYFPKPDVLQLTFDKNVREKDLAHALLLGNLYQSKVTIIFEDIEGVKKVCTTVWGITDKEVILKGDIILPIHRIVKVQ